MEDKKTDNHSIVDLLLEADIETAKSTYKNGILEVHLTKGKKLCQKERNWSTIIIILADLHLEVQLHNEWWHTLMQPIPLFVNVYKQFLISMTKGCC
jgi:hypothetical protein